MEVKCFAQDNTDSFVHFCRRLRARGCVPEAANTLLKNIVVSNTLIKIYCGEQHLN